LYGFSQFSLLGQCRLSKWHVKLHANWKKQIPCMPIFGSIGMLFMNGDAKLCANPVKHNVTIWHKIWHHRS
jgi:hypothetical protein